MSTFASLHDEYLESPPTVFKQTDDLTLAKDGGVIKHIISNGYMEV
jgi:tetratricopeptide (TPR) repeat protein